MTLTRKSLVRKIGQRTRLTNHQVELMLETLIDLCTEELGQGGRIALDNFLILEAMWIRHPGGGTLQQGQEVPAGYKVMLRARPGKKLYQLLKQHEPKTNSTSELVSREVPPNFRDHESQPARPPAARIPRTGIV